MKNNWLGLVVGTLAASMVATCATPTAWECAGELDMTIELAQVPTMLRATYMGNVVIDDCMDQSSGIVLDERTAHAVILNDGGFGYTPPSTVSLEVFDQGDCSGPEVLVFAVTNEPVPGAPFVESCTSATMFFAASEGCYGDDACDEGLTCSAQTECLPPPNCGDDPCPEVCYGYCGAP